MKVVMRVSCDDCGVFAVAYYTTLANGQDPSSFLYHQNTVRV